MLRILSSRRQSAGRFRFAPSPHLTAETRAIGANAMLCFIDAAERLGYGREQLLVGLRYQMKDLEARRARVSWRELTTLIANAERAGMSLAELERAGEYIAISPHLLLKPIVDFFLRPDHLYYVGLRYIAPATFPVLHTELEYRGLELRQTLELPAELPGCAAYFHICKGTLAAVPTAIGQPKARVLAAISARRATFEIRCAPFESAPGRIARIARALLTVPRVIETLVDQESAIRQGLDAALDSETRFLGILGALPEGVVIFRNDTIVYANAALARALGFERASELIGSSWSRFDPGTERDGRVTQNDGKLVVLELSPRQTIEYEGAPAELVVARDVTEKRELENRLALADRMASLATVAAGIAHEINNPLALVINNLELAARRGNGASDYIRAASEGADRVRSIVRELRVFSQPHAEPAVPIDLCEVVESSVALARGKVSARAKLSVERVPVRSVLGNRGKLSQVLLNLIINAHDALPSDRPASQGRIVVRLLERDGRARIEVEDNGVGIPEAARARVFEPFFTTRTSGGGSGLGLAVAHDIVLKSGGDIGFTSVLNSGTCFWFELPVCGESRVVAAPPAVAASTLRPLRILIADDEPSLVRALELALSQERHRVVSAASGREAIAHIDHHRDFDLILCDLMMPNGSGADVYAHVRETHPELAARIVFMTGGTFRGEAREFLASVKNPCLDKPFRLEELGRVVADFCIRSNGERPDAP